MAPPLPEQPKPLPATARWVLAAAFLAILAMMLVSGRSALRDLEAMHERERSARHQFFERTQALTGLCFSIQLYSETVQHYVVTPDTISGAAVRDLLDRVKSDLDQALREYPAGGEDPEFTALQGIQQLYL